MTEPGTKTRGKPTSAGTLPAAGGLVKPNCAGHIAWPLRERGVGEIRPAPEPSGHAITRSGTGRSSKKGLNECRMTKELAAGPVREGPHSHGAGCWRCAKRYALCVMRELESRLINFEVRMTRPRDH